MEARIPPARLRHAVFGLYALLLVASAWIHDDAYITFRTVDNFVNGLGPTWNPAERVQAYTHPLWMLLHSVLYALTGEIYFTSLVFSMALSLAVFALLLYRVPSTPWAAVAAGALLISCKSFVEYSTSGLENPLTHLLFIVFALVLIRGEHTSRNIFYLSLIATLGCVNRPDTVLLYVPAFIYLLFVRRARRTMSRMALGFVPLVLWSGFSLVYYGFLFPNTAYAKLGIGVARGSMLEAGGRYLLYSLLHDPVTWLLLLTAAFLVAKSRARIPGLLLAGCGLYLAYVVWIGGDYMGGRFLSVPALGAAVAVARVGLPELSRRRQLAGLAVASVLLVRSATAPITPGWLEVHGVGDERLRFYHTTGLLNAAFSSRPWPDHFFRTKGEHLRRHGPRVVVDAYVGLLGYYAGPDVYVVDLLGLPDPLLARLPGRFRGARESTWLPGHVVRPLPEGYLESLASGENRIADPSLASFYDKLRRVTRGGLWDAERWIDIRKLNAGAYDGLIDAYVEANPGDYSEPPADLRTLFTIDEEEVLRESSER